MPLKLIDPRPGRTPYFAIRGTHLGQYVNSSTKTTDRRLARKILAKTEDEIERGSYAQPGEQTFASAAIMYIESGGEKRFLTPVLKHFGEKPLRLITQHDLDQAALTLYPNATPATRNRQVYSPAIAVLRKGGLEKEFERPKGARGNQRTTFLSQEQARRLFIAAGTIDAEFRAFLIFLCYTGCRLSEACGLKADDVHLTEGWAYLRNTKNGSPRTVHLPPVVVAALSAHLQPNSRTAFRFRKNGRLYSLLAKVEAAAKFKIPDRVAFHIFRHTYGAWMKKQGADLVGTGAWKSKQAAAVYEHINVTEEAKKSNYLPVPPGILK